MEWGGGNGEIDVYLDVIFSRSGSFKSAKKCPRPGWNNSANKCLVSKDTKAMYEVLETERLKSSINSMSTWFIWHLLFPFSYHMTVKFGLSVLIILLKVFIKNYVKYFLNWKHQH